MANLIDMPNYASASASSKIWTIGFNNDFDHQCQEGAISSTDILKAIRILLEAVEKKKWPSENHAFHLINTSHIKKRISNAPNIRYRAIVQETY